MLLQRLRTRGPAMQYKQSQVRHRSVQTEHRARGRTSRGTNTQGNKGDDEAPPPGMEVHKFDSFRSATSSRRMWRCVNLTVCTSVMALTTRTINSSTSWSSKGCWKAFPSMTTGKYNLYILFYLILAAPDTISRCSQVIGKTL